MLNLWMWYLRISCSNNKIQYATLRVCKASKVIMVLTTVIRSEQISTFRLLSLQFLVIPQTFYQLKIICRTFFTIIKFRECHKNTYMYNMYIKALFRHSERISGESVSRGNFLLYYFLWNPQKWAHTSFRMTWSQSKQENIDKES